MLRCVNAFGHDAFAPNEGIGVGLHVFGTLIQKTNHDGAQENEGQQRDDGKNDDLPSKIRAKAGGQGRKTRADSKADDTETRRGDFEDDLNDGCNEPDLIDFHDNFVLILQI